MVYAHNVNRVTFSGTMWGGQEEWSTGFFLGQTGADAAPATQAAATALAAYFRTFFVAGNSDISSSYNFTMAKIAKINADGHTDASQVFYAAPLTAAVGGNPGKLPSQCSLVCSLASARPRGLAAKGRMYLPGLAIGPGSDGRLATSEINLISGTLSTMFNAIQGDPDIPDKMILAAKGTGLLPGLTAQNDVITHFKIGNVIDTQRRRRNGLSETYTSTTITP